MISNKDLYSELEKAEETMEKSSSEVDLMKVLVKLSTLQLKLLHNLRVNSVLAMKHAGMKFEKRSIDE
jgi:hypothetical protein